MEFASALFNDTPPRLSSLTLSISMCLTLTTTIIIILILRFTKSKLTISCKCSTCQTYVESRWSLRFTNLCDWYAHLLENAPGKTIHIHVLNNTITANPDNVEYMLKTRFDNFPKGKPFSAILGDFLGRGIFNVDGDSWRFQRKMASLELGRVSVRDFAFQVANQVISSRLIPLMNSASMKDDDDGDGVIIDLQDVLRRFSFDTICRFSFGLDPKCLELSEPLSNFAESFDLASQLSAQRAMMASPLIWKIKRLFNVGSERKLSASIKLIHELAQEVIRQRQKICLLDQDDLLSRFMANTKDKTYLRDIIISFLLAGRDTVASALTSLLWLVTKHRNVESLILSEADRVLGPNNEQLTSYEQLKGLHYLHAVVYESMRLYPPIQFDSKFCLEDDVLPDGTFVKKGTRVTYHPYAMGRMREIWGFDCLEFKPERWIRDGRFVHDSNNNYKYYPVFQGGLRVCLGKEMAIVEIKSVAVSLLRRFRYEFACDQLKEDVPRFAPGLTSTFRDGLRVAVRVRS